MPASTSWDGKRHGHEASPAFSGGQGTAAVLARGLLAGAAAMTLAEKVEQALPGRPNSYVPAHTLERLLGLPAKPDREQLGLNWAMHWAKASCSARCAR